LGADSLKFLHEVAKTRFEASDPLSV
jgi:hypothetical protein